jgi:hypothetical protein
MVGSPVFRVRGARGHDVIGRAAANDAVYAAGSDLQALWTDLNRLEDTVSAFMAGRLRT